MAHRCTASWEVEEGIWAMSLRHLVQDRQQLDCVPRLQKDQGQKEGEENTKKKLFKRVDNKTTVFTKYFF